MAVDWYYRSGDEVIGPLTGNDLRRHAMAGEISHTTLVSRSGTDEWVTADRVKGLLTVPTDDEALWMAPSEESGRKSTHTQVGYAEDFKSAWVQLFRALSSQGLELIGAGVVIAMIFIIIGVGYRGRKFVPETSFERANSPSQHPLDGPDLVDRESFYNPR